MTTKIPVFLASDDNYALLINVLLTSILENTKSDIDVFIIENNISNSKKNYIFSLMEKYSNCNIEFLKLDKDLFNSFPVVSHFTIDMYSRYLIPRLRPSLGKVIYSDLDIVFNGDIAELYNVDLGDKCLAAVAIPEDKQHSERLNLSENHKFLQSGVLLIDCEKWNEANITEKLLDKTMTMQHKLVLPDMDVLNIVFENDYKLLDGKYNIPVSDDLEEDDGKIKLFSAHYAGPSETKPWNNLNAKYGRYFWYYAKKSDCYQELFNLARKTTNDTYQVEYKLFDFLPLLKIKSNVRYKQIYLLNIQILKIRKKPNYRCYELFGFIPLLSRRSQ